MTLNRRKFIKGAVGAVALTALSQKEIIGANDKIRIGVMALGGRGIYLIENLVKRSDVEIAYICDADTKRYGRAAEIIAEEHGYKPKFVQDFRKMLDDSEVDVIVNATRQRWHALGTIMACQAGKDVYVEKPLSLSIWDGRKMVEAARKYKRIVQVGSQNRSAKYLDRAAEYVRSGKLGDIHLVRVFNMVPSYPYRKSDVTAVPEGLDYDLWCGPSPMIPYRPGNWWKGLWSYYSGDITGDLAHSLDIARYVLGKTYPETVYHNGGIYHIKDGREQPDTQIISYGFDGGLSLITESVQWAPYIKKVPQAIRESDTFPDWPFDATRIEIMGTEAFMYLGIHGSGWQVYKTTGGSRSRPYWQIGQKKEVIASEHGRQALKEHIDNFIKCLRSREKPNADVEEAHLTTLLCHAGNISYRVGNRKLVFDAKTETFINDAEANKLLKPEYREPWVVPEKV
ncbi:Gfo/Idh/MocA family protein [candidate division KSB1 bacterium]